MEQTKRIRDSKTLGANLVALAALIVQSRYGYVVDPELQGALIILANMGLRFITEKKLSGI
jgi:hypothetical protein